MSNDIYDLLEINSEENITEIVAKPENFAQHIFIHLGILFGFTGLFYYLLKSSNVDYAAIIILATLFLVFFVVLIVEIIYYQVKNKFQLRNAALFSISIFIMSVLILLFSVGF